MNGIKVILFDIDNTLLDFNKGAKAAMEKCLEAHGITPGDEMFDTFLRINDSLWRKIETAELTKAELHRTRWQLIFKELGIALDGEAFEKEFLTALQTSARPVDGAFETLDYLYGKYTLCAASNAPYEQQIKRLSNVGMMKYFSKLFISEKIGHSKPSREFFDACFNELPDISRNEAVIIGDSLTADIFGGIEYGLHTVWFNYAKADVPENLGADYVVNSLSEIKGIL